uniref:Uncharacterized protein n=1 Tax=Tetradesmus obliquus TaxID=3088 RepID=A0A383VQL7_TETOB|eukprot:jgi/Sobl393_1/16436/SZX67818.1
MESTDTAAAAASTAAPLMDPVPAAAASAAPEATGIPADPTTASMLRSAATPLRASATAADDEASELNPAAAASAMASVQQPRASIAFIWKYAAKPNKCRDVCARYGRPINGGVSSHAL